MTRKHFEALARALYATGASPDTINAVARVCAESNPHFDYVRFVAACTVGENR